MRLEVDADAPEAAQVVERRARLELAEYALEFGLREQKDIYMIKGIIFLPKILFSRVNTCT